MTKSYDYGAGKKPTAPGEGYYNNSAGKDPLRHTGGDKAGNASGGVRSLDIEKASGQGKSAPLPKNAR